MKNNYILTYNLNGWMPVNKAMSYKRKINNVAAYIRELIGEPAVIMLQEVIAGKEQRFLKLLKTEFSEYEVITPAFDYHQHYRSIMSITLIRKDVLGDYTVKVLYDELPNRINYVIAEIAGVEYRLINTHCVQVSNFKNQAAWYIHERTRLNTEMWKLLINEADNYKDSNVVIAGDLQESKYGCHIGKIIDKGYKKDGTHIPTVYNCFFTENYIDHIIFSEGAYKELKPITVFADNSEVGNLSDHALVYAACVL